jgi:hypothetical protein
MSMLQSEMYVGRGVAHGGFLHTQLCKLCMLTDRGSLIQAPPQGETSILTGYNWSIRQSASTLLHSSSWF